MESDLPRKLEFGISINPSWSEHEEMLALVRLAESGGLDLVGVQDHPYQWRFYDTWTLISYLGGATSSIRFFPDVAALPLRPPAMLAKSVASLDVLTGGRVELGLGAGAFWEAIGAMGGEVRSRAEAVAAIEEAIDVIRLVWSGERGVRYQGRHYRLSGLHTGPEPVHDIGIWVGNRITNRSGSWNGSGNGNTSSPGFSVTQGQVCELEVQISNAKFSSTGLQSITGDWTETQTGPGSFIGRSPSTGTLKVNVQP